MFVYTWEHIFGAAFLLFWGVIVVAFKLHQAWERMRNKPLLNRGPVALLLEKELCETSSC